MAAFRNFSEGFADRQDLLTECVKERGLKCASKWKNGIRACGGDKDYGKTRFGQGSGCRHLVLVMFEMPIRDQAEKLRGSWAQGPGVQVQAGQMNSGVRVLMVFQAMGQDEVP